MESHMLKLILLLIVLTFNGCTAESPVGQAGSQGSSQLVVVSSEITSVPAQTSGFNLSVSCPSKEDVLLKGQCEVVDSNLDVFVRDTEERTEDNVVPDKFRCTFENADGEPNNVRVHVLCVDFPSPPSIPDAFGDPEDPPASSE